MRLASRLAAELRAGDVLGLTGELGTGKTTFVRGMAAALGAGDRVVSPSFILVAEYEGRLPLTHLDLYRLKSEEEMLGIGLPDLVAGAGVAAVEWCEKWGSLEPASWLEVVFEIDDANEGLHRLAFRPHGKDWRERWPHVERILKEEEVRFRAHREGTA